MSESQADRDRRLERLGRVFAERRAHLATASIREPTRLARARPIVTLQHHGYSVALLLALTAVLPRVLGFVLKRRKLLFSTAAAGLRVRKWRKQLGAMQTDASRR